jgi:hypothetical protein
MLEKLKILNKDTKEQLDCLFNPAEYTVAKTIDWSPRTQPGNDAGETTFTGGRPCTLNMELMFDVLEAKNEKLKDYLDKLWRFAMVDPANKNPQVNQSRPPILQFTWGTNFTWGSNKSFLATITSLSVRYTLFKEDGTPVRAVCTLQLQEVVKPPAGQNPTSKSDPGLKCREVRPSDTLQGIAYEEYGDATKWRSIALANDIDDPMDLRPGRLLSIPVI